MSKPIILITGGSGFVGRAILQDVIHHAPDFALASVSSRPVPPYAPLPNVAYYTTDIFDAREVDSMINQIKPMVIIHTASPKPFIHHPSVYEKVNIIGTRNLLQFAQRMQTVKAFIYTSSCSVIHDGTINLIMADESAPVLYAPDQKVPYWLSKAIAETDVLRANRTNGSRMLTTALRVTAIFGKHDEQITNALVEQARRGQLRIQIGDNTNLNDWTYVGNVAYAHRLAMRALLKASAFDTPAPEDERVEDESFFITNDEPRRV